MKEESNPLKIEISHRTVIFIALLVIGIWLIIQLTEIILLLVFSFILLSALLKPVDWLADKKVPRIVSVFLIYVIIVVIIGLIISLVVPPLITQTTAFINKLPDIIQAADNISIFRKLPIENLSTIITRQVGQLTGDIVTITKNVFTIIFLMVTTFVLTLYLLLEWKGIIQFAVSPFSGKQEKKAINIITRVEDNLGKWVRGQVLLSLAVGVLTFIGLNIIGIPFSLPLAVIAGLLEIVPIIGPLISAIPAVLVGLTISPVLGLLVVFVFLIVQQIENHLFVPVVMSKVVGVQPPIIIIALLIGTKLAGITGAFLSVPVIVVVKVLSKELFMEGKHLEEEILE